MRKKAIIALTSLILFSLVGCSSAPKWPTAALIVDSVQSELKHQNLPKTGTLEKVQVDGNIITITYTTPWLDDTNLMLSEVSYYDSQMMKDMFTNSNVETVNCEITTDFTQSDGSTKSDVAISITVNKDTANKINWDTMSKDVYNDSKALTSKADNAWINPVIAKELGQ